MSAARRLRTAPPWERFLPILWLYGLLLGTTVIAIAATSGDPDPTSDAIVTAIDAGIVVAFCWLERRTILPMLRIGQMSTRDWGFAGLALVTVTVAVEAWFFVARLLFDEVRYLGPFRQHGWPLWSAFVLISVCPAVFEELAFRGFLLQRMAQLMQPRDALVLQATLFSILHLSVVVLPSHFLFGLVLGWLALRTRSLVPGMLIHALWNATVLVREIGRDGWP